MCRDSFLRVWRVRRTTTQPATLSLSALGQGPQECTAVFAEERPLINAAELIDWGKQTVQLEICEQCGIQGCSSGAWVAPRWTGSHLLLLPDFTSMMEGEFERTERAPPKAIAERGIAVLSESALIALSNWIVPNAVPPMTGRDLLRTMQWEAPFQVLGRFPDPVRVRRDLILACTAGDADPILDALEEALERLNDREEAARLQKPPEAHQPIGLFLNDSSTTEWTPLVRIDGTYKLALAPDLVAV